MCSEELATASYRLIATRYYHAEEDAAGLFLALFYLMQPHIHPLSNDVGMHAVSKMSSTFTWNGKRFKAHFLSYILLKLYQFIT